MDILGAGAWKFLLFIVVLGVLVVFHELGHFLAARLVGIRVEVFSFGFGSRLFGRRIGHTDYRVSLVPLGGYVKMAGDGVEAEGSGAPHEFESRKAWEKLLVMGAGPAFNLVLAVLLLGGANMMGVTVPAWLKAPVRVEHVEPGSPAEAAGLAAGDLVTKVNGRDVPDWEHFNEIILVSPGHDVGLEVVRDGVPRDMTLAVQSRTSSAIGWAGLHPCYRVIVRGVTAGSAAAEAGLKAGDEVLETDGTRVCSAEGLVRAVQAAKGAPLALTLKRDDALVALSAAPRWDEEAGKWLIGVSPGESAGETLVVHHGPARALQASLATNWRHTKLLFTTLGRLLTGGLSMRTMSGPIELADIAEETAELGIVPLLQLMALVSLNLGILNLVPIIPLLDGGRMLLILVEWVRGRSLARQTKEWILQAGFVMIVALMAVVIYFDIVKKLGN